MIKSGSTQDERMDNHRICARGFVDTGAAETGASGRDQPDSAQTRFFDLISRSSPDVIVLDFSRGPVRGTDTILTVRRRTEIPILVVCNPEQSQIDDCRIAGAADCITAPVEIVSWKRTRQRSARF